MGKLALLQLDDDELKRAQNKDSDNNALAFAVMLKYFQLENHYPTSLSDIDGQLLQALADQLEIKSFDLETFDWDGRTVKRFRAEIRDCLGYRKATDADAQPFILWLMQEHLKHAPSLEKTVEFSYEYFKQKRIEPFSEKQLLRYIKSANAQFEDHVFNNVYQALSSKSLDHIEILLKQQEEDDKEEEKQLEQHIELMSEKESDENIKEKITPETDIRLRHLKQDIPGAKLKHVEFELKKIALVKQCVLPQDLLEEYSIELVKKYYLRILVEHAGLIKRRSKKDYCAMTALFLHYRSQNMLDTLSDMTVQLIHGLRKKSETYINKTVLKEVKHINGKFDILYRLASISTQYPQGIIQDKIYPIVSEDMLRDLLTDLDHRGKWYQGEVNLKIHSLYAGGNRQLLLTLLEAFDLRTHLPECKPILSALDFIRENKELKDVYYPDTDKVLIEGVVSSQWTNLVIQPDEDHSDKIKIHKIRYEIAVLEAFMKQLICKNIWIAGSYRYRDPYHDMPKDFDERKVFYYDWMGLPIDAKAFIELLKNNTHHALARLNETLPNNEKVKLKQLKKGNRITVTPYDAQPEPPTLHKLHVAIQKKWSTINLIDILKETDLREDFTRHLQSVACREHLPRDILTKRLLLALFGIGSNAGLKRIQAANADVTYDDLLYVKKRFLHVDSVREAIVQIVNAIRRIRDPHIWGTASTGCACDSTHVACWNQNLLSHFHPRYKKQGVMIYWHVDKKAACIYSQLKTCASSEVGAMIHGYLKHDTEMNMDKTYTDTHGQSVIGFAVSHLLGFELLPRFKNIHKQKLFYPDAKDKNLYPNLELILKDPINWKIIEENYDEVVQHMVALKKGTVEADVLIKRFNQDNDNHPVHKALTEIGKAIKTQFLCRYLEEESLRIEIHEALNVVERLNGAMSFMFYGKLGEISTNKTHDQELTVVCLHLLQVCMVYINTLIIQEILAEPKWKNVLTQEDLRALTPLIYEHINPYGLFPLDLVQRLHFSLEQLISNGEKQVEPVKRGEMAEEYV